MSSDINQSPQYSDTPLGLKLQQTFSTPGTFPVTIPAGIRRVYAIVVGGGGGGGANSGGLSATITNAVGNGSSITYTANNSFIAGAYVSISGIQGFTTANFPNGVQIASSPAPTSTTFNVTSALTGTYSSGGTAIIAQTGGLSQSGGGGAGGYSQGWTYVSNTVIVGTGGTPGVNFTNGTTGGSSIYGMVMAGGGGGGNGGGSFGLGGLNDGTACTSPGGAGGGQITFSISASQISYTGAPAVAVASYGYAGPSGGRITDYRGFGGFGVSGGGGGMTTIAGFVYPGIGGNGLIGGGGAAATVTATTAYGGNGGSGDFYLGGSGYSSTTTAFSAGGGGAGLLSAGNAGSLTSGGAGGLGGGGGGSASFSPSSVGGAGGDGAVLLFY